MQDLLCFDTKTCFSKTGFFCVDQLWDKSNFAVELEGAKPDTILSWFSIMLQNLFCVHAKSKIII